MNKLTLKSLTEQDGIQPSGTGGIQITDEESVISLMLSMANLPIKDLFHPFFLQNQDKSGSGCGYLWNVYFNSIKGYNDRYIRRNRTEGRQARILNAILQEKKGDTVPDKINQMKLSEALMCACDLMEYPERDGDDCALLVLSSLDTIIEIFVHMSTDYTFSPISG